MERIEKELLLSELDRYGYQLVRSRVQKPEDTLNQMVQSDDQRLLEGVPVVLTHMLVNKELHDLEAVENSLPSSLQKRFRLLAALTYHFLFWVPKGEEAADTLLRYLRQAEPALLEQVRHDLLERTSFKLGKGMAVDMTRLEKTYKNYVVARLQSEQETMAQKVEHQRQNAFQESLGELFTARQKELLFKLLKSDELTKTEKEYYSRTIKPRLKALCNSDLQSFASSLLNS